jgi:hypothetical protein
MGAVKSVVFVGVGDIQRGDIGGHIARDALAHGHPNFQGALAISLGYFGPEFLLFLIHHKNGGALGL